MVCLGDSAEPAAAAEVAFSDVDEALDCLARLNDRQSQVAGLRIFGGLTIEEAGGIPAHFSGYSTSRLDVRTAVAGS